MTTLEFWGFFDRTQLAALLSKVQKQLLAKLCMCHLPAPKTDRDLDLISVLQKLLRLIEPDVEIVDTNTNAELQFLCFHNALILTGFLFTFGLFKSIFTIVHDTADGRASLRGDLHKVKSFVKGNFLCVLNGHDAKLGTVLINEADFTILNSLVDLMLYITDAKTPPIKK